MAMSEVSEDVDEDYMSDVFVKDEHQSVKHETKKLLVRKKHKPNRSVKFYKQSEESKIREEGLNRPLSGSNKGFELLCKMGYEPGAGLGRTGNGRREPIPLLDSKDRQGLGRKEFVLLKEEAEKRKKADQLVAFREQQHSKHCSRQINSDLVKCQSACEQLDSNHGIKKPEYDWFWRSMVVDGSDDDDDDDDDEHIEVDEKLHIISNYLNTRYLYCTWCGSCYKDKQDMEKNCPGNSRSAHET